MNPELFTVFITTCDILRYCSGEMTELKRRAKKFIMLYGVGGVGWITHLVPSLKVKSVCEGPGPGPDVKEHGFIHNERSETK